MLIDSHCHLNMLDLTPFDGDLSAVIADAQQNGVERIVCISVDLIHLPEVLAIADQYDGVYASVGVHPSEFSEPDLTVSRLVECAAHPKVVAIGETGLDYYYNETGFAAMQQQFRIHIAAAHEVKKPLIIHTRSAHKDTIEIMQQAGASTVGGVMHCFTESWEMAEQALDMGFYISFSGIVTFKNAVNVQEVAAKVPLENMLIETDAPYLTPVPFRGKPNRPAHVKYVAQKIAEIKGVTVEQVEMITTKNSCDLFSIN